MNFIVSFLAAKPYIFQAFETRYNRPGSRVSLKCATTGNPTPSVLWTLDDQPLPQDSRYSQSQYRTSQGDVVYYLNVTNVRVQDGGEYKCLVSNKAGSAHHRARVNIYGKYPSNGGPRILNNYWTISKPVEKFNNKCCLSWS